MKYLFLANLRFLSEINLLKTFLVDRSKIKSIKLISKTSTNSGLASHKPPWPELNADRAVSEGEGGGRHDADLQVVGGGEQALQLRRLQSALQNIGHPSQILVRGRE